MSVFISYRRDTGRPIAEAIYQYFHRDYEIFLDTETLKNGYFDDAILRHIRECDDFLLIVTASTFQRCGEPNDWITQEASAALEANKNIIPIFVGVDRFPAELPPAFADLARFNGIVWGDPAESCKKLQSFLISNGRIILSTQCRGAEDGMLSDSSRADLTQLYKRFLLHGRRPVKVKVELADQEALAQRIIREDIVKTDGMDIALLVARQTLASNFSARGDALEKGIEALLQNEALDAWAQMNCLEYAKRYGNDSCSYTDASGKQHSLWTCFLWMDVIENMLRYLLHNVAYDHMNSEQYLPIDVVLPGEQKGRALWHFVSFIRQEDWDQKANDPNFVGYMINAKATVHDIAMRSITQHILPDFYFNLGMLMTNHLAASYALLEPYAQKLLSLEQYRIGLH